MIGVGAKVFLRLTLEYQVKIAPSGFIGFS